MDLEALDALVDEWVARALAGEDSLERIVAIALMGRPLRHNDPPWPRRAQAVWSLAVHRYTMAKRTGDAEQADPVITIEQAWVALGRLAPDADRWWVVPTATWPVIARTLGAGSRTVHYYLHDVQGWRLKGPPRARVILYAPCIECGIPIPPPEIHERRCRICA